MKKNNKIFLLISCFLILQNCHEPYLRQDFSIKEELGPVISEPSINDPQNTGVACSNFSLREKKRTIIDPNIIEIPNDLPDSYDLSEDMPPVRSQGKQGSCVGWAVGYYLKSYQEKIQHKYEYSTFNDVMSPSFIYNQIKENNNCNSGAEIEKALELLKNTGITQWSLFPYLDTECSELPSEDLLKKASHNKIKEYYILNNSLKKSDKNYTLTNLIKTYLSQKKPIITTIDCKNLFFKFIDDIYIANEFAENPNLNQCGHALLIVGYNNEFNAFKIINSWGTDWGNEGYAWINYNFFLPSEHPDHRKGLSGVYVTYDEE